MAKTVVGAFSDRYALPAVIGLSIIVAWGLHRSLAARRAPAVALALVLVLFLAVKEAQTHFENSQGLPGHLLDDGPSVI
jgi:hypothetical protein